jgi:hypothetical protein
VVRAAGCGDRGLLRRRGQGDDDGAAPLRHLHQQLPDPARRGMDQHPGPGADCGAVRHQILRGQSLQQDRRGLPISDVVRQRDRALHRHGHAGGVGEGHVGEADAVAEADALDPIAQRHHLARAFIAGDMRRRAGQAVVAAAAVQVGEVQPGRSQRQLHMPRRHRRVGQGPHLQHLGAAEPVEHQRFHESLFPQPPVVPASLSTIVENSIIVESALTG